MKSLKLIESRNIDNDVAETLLPTLSDKKMNEIVGGLSCDSKFYDGPTSCYQQFVVTVCAKKVSCGALYREGSTASCDLKFSHEYSCWLYNG